MALASETALSIVDLSERELKIVQTVDKPHKALSVCFSEDGKRLYTGNEDSTISIYEME